MYTLIRERDNLTKVSQKVKWIEWNEEGEFESDFPTVKVGRSLIMSPFNQAFTWQTTEVVRIVDEIESQGGGFIKFKTRNSTYTLTYLHSNEIEVRPYSEIGLKNN